MSTLEHADPGARPADRQAGRPPGRPAGRPAGQRVAAVDVVRGLLLVVIVVSGSLVEPPAWFDHAPWAGVHLLDLVFPSFVLLMGVGLGFACARGVQLSRLPRRVLVLLAAGLVYNAAVQWARLGTVDLDQLRWTGVLQVFALVTLVISLVHLVVRGWVAWTGAALALAAAHTWLLARWAATCPGGELTPACNPSLGLDPALLPARHLYWQMDAGHDPEGLVAVLGACATAAAGVAAAHALRGRPATPDGSTARAAAPGPVGRALAAAGLVGQGVLPAAVRLVVVAAVLVAGARVASLWVPPMKRLWTAPFGLSVAAGVVALVAVVHLLVDAPWVQQRRARGPAAPAGGRGGARRRAGGGTSGGPAAAAGAAAAVRGLREPFVALGRNSLLVYVASEVLAAFLLLRPLRADPALEPSHAQSLAEGLAWVGSPQLGLSAALLAGWWLLALLLHRRRWYLRA
jgi:heparan-alpha-glucosaminide N-acetyltransferase